MKRQPLLLILVLLMLSASACGPLAMPGSEESQLRRIRLPMGYVPNIQYAPFYVGMEKGFFAEENLEIDFDYSYETDGVALVGANELQFSLASGEQVPIARAEGLPIVYVMAWYGKYPVAVIAKGEQGITEPEDLAGKRVGLPGLFGANYVGLRALLAQAGLKESDLRLDSIGFNQVEVLATDANDAVVGYLANEPIQLRAQGYDIDVIAVADYVDLVSNGLITNQVTIENEPELVRGMVSATMKAIQYTVENPDEAYEISKKFVEGLEDADRQVQMDVLKTSISLYQTDPYGYSDQDAWENMQQVLLQMGLMKEEIELNETYSNEFIR